ncbi:MAG: hypothetical protein ACUVRZ_00870 [Desulfobacca sp.]|uniref:hypothetical protein n=1 Tax=Desulfobacca sp. TaxID=2067990 RepID=UPI00404A24F1
MHRWIAIFLAVFLLAGADRAGAQYIPDPDVQGKINDARQRLSLTGRIAYAQELGGYFLQSGKAGNKIILNQNYERLQEIARSRREVKIQGRINPLDVKARHIFIETIDGKPYHGDKAPLVKPPTKVTPWF